MAQRCEARCFHSWSLGGAGLIINRVDCLFVDSCEANMNSMAYVQLVLRSAGVYVIKNCGKVELSETTL